MGVLFLILFFLSSIGVVVALINPRLVRMRARPKAMLTMAVSTFVFLMLTIATIPSDDKETKVTADVEEVTTEEDAEKVEEVSEDANTLNDDEVKAIKATVEESIKSDRELGDIYFLDNFEYDKEANKLKMRIEMRQDPLPTKQDIIAYAESMVWYTDSQLDKEVDIRVSSVIEIDGGHAVFGRAMTKGDDIVFKEDKAMQLFD